MLLTLPGIAIRVAAIAFVLGSGSALAADAKQIADLLVAATVAEAGTEATYESAVAEGEDVTITGFKVMRNAQTVTLPSIALTAVTLRDKGGFTAAKMTLGPASIATRGQTVAWQSVSLDQPLVPSAEEVKANVEVAPFTRLAATGLTISGARVPAPFNIASVDVGLTADPDGTPRTFSVNLTGMEFTPEFFAKNYLTNTYLGLLGYKDGFVVNFTVAGAYETATDTLTLDNLTIDTVGVAKLTLAGKFSGVSLRKLGAMQMREVQSTGKLERFTIRFENGGVVDRLLDMQVKTQGISKEDAIAQATAGLSFFFLMTMPNEAFQTKVVEQVSVFLAAPRAITFSAAPKEPVPFDTLYDALGEEPETFPDLIGADVIAND